MQKFLTIGIDSIDKNKFVNVKNENFVKPAGGLWASPYTPNEEYQSSWHEWCNYNMPEWIKDYGVVFELKFQTKILIIDTIEDVNKTFESYGINNDSVLDFEKISKDYDCIYLTQRGENITRFNRKYSLYGWDVESLLVLNIDCIFNSYKIKVDLPDIF